MTKFTLSRRMLKAITIPWEPPKHACLVKWRKRIEKAKEHGGFTARDARAALDWSACACGEAYAKFDGLTADAKGHEPRDGELEMLGCEFADAVCDEEHYFNTGRCKGETDVRPARQILKAIERRLRQLDWEFRAAHKAALKYYHQTGDLSRLRDLFAGISKILPE